MEVQVSMSQTVGAIAAALAKAQAAMKPAVKDSKNPHFRNTYASLASCFDALQPLYENGIAVLQPPALSAQDGVVVSTLLIHASGEWIRGDLYMPASKKDAQGFGSALSYARRYCLTSTVGLATDDDDAERAVKPDVAQAKPAAAPAGVDPWGLFVDRYSKRFADAENAGALNEAWSDLNAEMKKTPPPPQVVENLKIRKDHRKAELNGGPKS